MDARWDEIRSAMAKEREEKKTLIGPDVMTLLHHTEPNVLRDTSFGPYIFSVRKKIKEIYDQTEPSMRKSAGDYGFLENYFEVVGDSNDSQIKDNVISLVLPGDSYKDNDIYTAMYHAARSTQLFSEYRRALKGGKCTFVVNDYGVDVENIPRYEEFPPYVRDALFNVSFAGIEGRGDGATDIDQAKKMFFYVADLVMKILIRYHDFIADIFEQMEGKKLGDDFTENTIQKMWKEKYAPL